MDIFIELSIVIALAAALSIVMKILRQPLVVGYILTGILAGPYFFNMLGDITYLDLFSKIGIATLLFIVGLNLSPKIIKEVGVVSLLTSLGQVVLTSLIGFFIITSLGFSPLSSLYIAVALTFSSTIIVLKLLSDKNDLNQLYGKISLGFLIVQDIIAAILLIAISTFSKIEGDASFVVPLIVLKIFAIILTLYLVSKYIIPLFGKFFASSQELLFLFSIAWGLGISSIFFLLGFSMEIGALVAGIVLSYTPFSIEIGARMKPLRDFFIVLFFILLGSQMIFVDIEIIIVPALLLSLFILIGNPLILFIIMNLLGYKRKTSFLVGITVAQISEFSLILVALGATLGHIPKDVVSLVTLIGLITIAGCTYLILYEESIYPKVERFLKFFEWRSHKKRIKNTEDSYEIVLFGYDRVGGNFVDVFKTLGKNFLVVDFNPSAIARLGDEHINFLYGDADDVEFLETLPLSQFRLVVSTLPNFKTNCLLVETLRKRNPHAIVLTISHKIDEAEELYKRGVTYVVMPHYLGAHHAAKMISKHGLHTGKFDEEREKHLAFLLKSRRR